MTKLKFNYDQLKSVVIKSLIQTEDNLNPAIKTSNSLDIPGGFSCAGVLNSMNTFLSSQKNTLNDMQLKLEKSNKEYSIIDKELFDTIGNIKKCDLKDRESIIIK